MKKQAEIFEFRCNKCHMLQPKDKKTSNQNWSVYKANKKCKCGGIYTLKINQL